MITYLLLAGLAAVVVSEFNGAWPHFTPTQRRLAAFGLGLFIAVTLTRYRAPEHAMRV